MNASRSRRGSYSPCMIVLHACIWCRAYLLVTAMLSTSLCIARPLGLDRMQDGGIETIHEALFIPKRKKRALAGANAGQTSAASASAQGESTVTAVSFAQVVSDGNGNQAVIGKAEASAQGGISSQVTSSTSGYASLGQDTDESSSYVVNAASGVAAQQSQEGSGNAEAQASGTSSVPATERPSASATHKAEATGTLSASQGENTVIISQNKPMSL